MSVNYDKWEVLARQQEKEEEDRKMRERFEARAKHEREQDEKKKKWLLEHPEEAEAHAHGHGHTHSCCGFATPAEIEAATKRKAAQPQYTVEEKNQKKKDAVEATRLHGNELFKEGKYEHANAVYDRGILIINGCYGMSDEDMDALTATEHKLNLNMAACQLKLGNNLRALELCRTALSIDKNAPKAHFRMAQAHVNMGEFEEALKDLEQVKALGAAGKESASLAAKIKQLQEEQKAKTRDFQRVMGERMAKKTARKNVDENTDENTSSKPESS